MKSCGLKSHYRHFQIFIFQILKKFIILSYSFPFLSLILNLESRWKGKGRLKDKDMDEKRMLFNFLDFVTFFKVF